LTAPFATAYPRLLQAALQAFNAIVSNGWPRVAFHRGEILEGLIVCWCSIQGESLSSDLEPVMDSLQHTVKILTATLQETINVEEEYRVLIDSDSRLRDLLIV